jgi:hypothetical protein
MERLITNPDERFRREEAAAPYPYLRFDEIGDEFGVLMDCLEPGTLPVTVKQNGELLMLGPRVSGSPFNLKKIIGVRPFTVVNSPQESRAVANLGDLREVIPWTLRL